MHRLKKKILVVILSAAFLFNAVIGPAMAQETMTEVSGEGMVVDLVLLRPLGLVATAGGCVFFVASLPFTIWSEKRIKDAGHHLVVVPGYYTFVRPLGDLKEHPDTY